LDDQGYPYITPVNYIFQEGRIYFHSSPKGEKMENLSRNSRVCFEVDIPLSYLGVEFNPEENPCRAHQLYHSVIIRGIARILPEGQKKVDILNELVAKHEGHRFFTPITQESSGYLACRVIEISLERVTAKSELAQSHPQQGYRALIMKRLAERGWPGDLEAMRAMKKVRSIKKTGKIAG
jgi:nitroimidazol reductase NimA-like FMN-containing flavoprotein (pyridoxamine 5'-phosphate oxidase superfamily)